MKIAIVFHSQTGNTKKIAEFILQGIEKAGDIEVKLMELEEMDYDFIKESKCVVFGTPTYYASMAWQMKKWFDTANCNLSNKLGCCFATANFMGGGSEVAMTDLIHHMLVKGMLVYSSGSGSGQPFIHLGAAAVKGGDSFHLERASIFGQRIGKKTLELFEK